MDLIVLNSQQDDYRRGVADFLDSLGWTYLTHRYPAPVQRLLLRLLTLSGLDPWCWERYAMQTVSERTAGSIVLRLLDAREDTAAAVALRQAVDEIRNYAEREGASLGEPPVFPSHLAEYGYTQEQYVTDLSTVYAGPIEARYTTPWPPAPLERPSRLIQPVALRRAAALMGATAGAIERLMAPGGDDAGRDR